MNKYIYIKFDNVNKSILENIIIDKGYSNIWYFNNNNNNIIMFNDNITFLCPKVFRTLIPILKDYIGNLQGKIYLNNKILYNYNIVNSRIYIYYNNKYLPMDIFIYNKNNDYNNNFILCPKIGNYEDYYIKILPTILD